MRSEGEQQDWMRHRREAFAVKEQALRAAREEEHQTTSAMIRDAME